MHVTFADGFGNLEQSVSQRTFPVVDVRNDAKISDIIHLQIVNWPWLFIPVKFRGKDIYFLTLHTETLFDRDIKQCFIER